jgi:hypothetical protein
MPCAFIETNQSVKTGCGEKPAAAETISEREMSGEVFGLVPVTEMCRCELHGFEVDLDGNVVLPTLSPNHPIGEDMTCSIH